MYRYRFSLVALGLMLFALHLSCVTSYAATGEQRKVSGSLSNSSVASLPQALQAAVSDSVGHDDPAYFIKETGGNYQGNNAAHRLSMDFKSNGIRVRSGGSQWGLRLNKIGYGDDLRSVPSITPRVKANRTEYEHAGITEWYVNGPLGLEQGFTIDRAPVSQKAGPLTLELSTVGDLRASVEGAGAGLLITEKDGTPVLRYSGLQAFDATGRQLHAWLQLDGVRLLVRVEDSDAHYPIVVDPWVQQAKLVDPSDGYLGSSVSLSADGNTALIGSAGVAYVFTRSGLTWTQQQKLTVSNDTTVSQFGSPVSLSGDGNTALISAIGSMSLEGAVYVFTRSGSTWTQQQELTVSDGSGDNTDGFGRSLSLSGDGNTALIGASGRSFGTGWYQGAVYVFTRSGSTWTQRQELTASDRATCDGFGTSVSLSGDGKTALIGASGEGGPYCSSFLKHGAAYVFTQPKVESTFWTQQQKLTASDGAFGYQFGNSVSLSGDGNTALIGGAAYFGPPPAHGVAYVFTRSGWTWTQQQELTISYGGLNWVGLSVSLSGDGNTALIGFPSPAQPICPPPDILPLPPCEYIGGWAYVYRRSGSTWTLQQELWALDGAIYYYFGVSVSLSGDGNTALIGAWDINPIQQGAAYVFAQPEVAICRPSGFWGTHSCPETITNGVITNGCEKSGSQNITQDVINAAGGCLSICGEAISDTRLSDANSAVEAMCASSNGGILLKLARELTATALNCVMSGYPSSCSGLTYFGLNMGEVFTACNSSCAAGNVTAIVGDTTTFTIDTIDCVSALKCFNDGGNFDPKNGTCQLGICEPYVGVAEIPCGVGFLSCPTGTNCVPLANNCHDRALCQTAGASCRNGSPCNGSTKCADYSECTLSGGLCFDATAAGVSCPSIVTPPAVCTAVPGPVGSSKECSEATSNKCAIIFDSLVNGYGEIWCTYDAGDVCAF